METDPRGARAQLSEFDAAVDVSTSHSVRMASWWVFPIVALLGPAIVLGLSSFTERAGTPEEPLLTVFQVATVTFGVIVACAGFKEWTLERANPVRPLAPIRGGRMSKWLFAHTFAIVFGMTIPMNMLTINDFEHPIPLAIVSYLWLAIVPRIFHRRHIEMVRGA